MAHLQHFPKHQKSSFIEGLGNKVRTAAEIIGTAKGIYDASKMVYGLARSIGPQIGPVVTLASTLI